MSKHFISSIKIEGREPAAAEERLVISAEEKTVSLQPHPLSPFGLHYQFDHVYTERDESKEVYRSSVREIVEGTLLGYHGTVILFGTKGSQQIVTFHADLIEKASRHIFKCLQRSKEGGSSQSTTNLIVLCSYVMLMDERLHDLLAGEGEPEAAVPPGSRRISAVDPGGGKPDPGKEGDGALRIDNGALVGATALQAKSLSKILSLLKEGADAQASVLPKYGKNPESGLYHTIFSLSVEYANFGTMNAPVSGNLSFVLMGAAEPLTQVSDRGEGGDQFPVSVASLLGFAAAVRGLTGGGGDAATSDPPFIAPGVASSAVFERFALTQLLKEALGGNCKTLLLSFVPSTYPTGARSEVSKVLDLASRSCAIQNHPNKRILAEKALMTAYMKELQKQYGGIQGPSENGFAGEATPPSPEEKPSERKVEMAASALAAAATECGSEDDETEDTPDDRARQSFHPPSLKLKREKKTQHSHVSKLNTKAFFEAESPVDRPSSSASNHDMDVTIDVLVAVLQDPDHGVPRALNAALKDSKIKKDAGAVFSGADIVRWMMANIAGVDTESDAENLGQMLVDRGVVSHTEGSSVFANAESLLYEVQSASRTRHTLSKEEIQALLRSGGRTSTKSTCNTTQVAPQHRTNTRNERKKNTRKHKRNSEEKVVERDPHSHCGGENAQDHQNKMEGSDPDQDQWSQNRGTPSYNHEGTPSYSHEGIPSYNNEGTPSYNHDGDPSYNHDGMIANSKGNFHPHLLLPTSDGQAELHNGQAELHNGLDDPNQPHFENSIRSQDGREQHESRKAGTPDHSSDGDNGQLHSSPSYAPEDTGAAEEPNGPSVRLIEMLPTMYTLETVPDYPHPLHMAAAVGKAPGVLSNLAMMFGVDTLDDFKRTPLMFAALGNKRASCATLIECGADVNHRDSSGLTALHVACYHGNRDALSVLLSKNAITGFCDKQGHSAIHWSTVPASPDCLRFVLRYSTSKHINEPDKKGLTPLHWALHYDHPDHIKMLLRYTDPLKLDSIGRTFLTYAIEREAICATTVLLQYCPELLTLSDINGSTPFHHASVLESHVFLKILFEFAQKACIEVDINHQDKCRQTPLHCSAICGRPYCTEILLKKGALKDIVDEKNMTALDYAKSVGGVRTVGLLDGTLTELPIIHSERNSQTCVVL